MWEKNSFRHKITKLLPLPESFYLTKTKQLNAKNTKMVKRNTSKYSTKPQVNLKSNQYASFNVNSSILSMSAAAA